MFVEDFETLEKLIVPLFGQIKKKNVKIPMVTTPIYEEEQLSTKTIIIPLLNYNLLSIDFLIPDQTKYFKTAVMTLQTKQTVLNLTKIFTFFVFISLSRICLLYLMTKGPRVLLLP